MNDSKPEITFNFFTEDNPEGTIFDTQVPPPTSGDPSAEVWLVLSCLDQHAWTGKHPLETAHGWLLKTALQQGGMNVPQLYICSVGQSPASNYIAAGYYRPTHDELLDFAELVDKHKPKLLLIAGEALLNTLGKQRGLDNWRGTFLQYSESTWLLPIYDHGRLLADPPMRYLMQMDCKKISYLNKVVNPPKRNYITDPTFQECMNYLDYLHHEAEIFSVDIETSSDSLYCIGFSDAPYQAFVLPIMNREALDKSRWLPEQEAELLLKLAAVMENPLSTKVMQNAMFDCTFLYEKCGIMTKGPIWDTMVTHNLLYPDLKKNLGLLTSIYTLDPYYKEEGKIWKNAKIDEQQFFLYNAKDADVTLRIHYAIMLRLEKRKQTQQADTLSQLHHPIWHMSLRGIKVNVERKAELAAAVDVELEQIQLAVDNRWLLAEHEKERTVKGEMVTVTIPEGPLTLTSSDEVKIFLYDQHKLPKQYKMVKQDDGSRKKVLTASESALVELRKQLQGKTFAEGGAKDLWRKDLLEFLELLLTHRELSKLRGTYYYCPISDDNRIRSNFNIAGTETGRLASSSYLDGTGTNLQNTPKIAREYLIPDDEESVILNCDLAQAEARVVAYASGDRGLIALFTSGIDYHTANAMNVWGIKDPYDVTPEQRQLAKRGGHGLNYGMTAETMAVSLGIPLPTAKEFISIYFGAYPGLLAWHRDIDRKLNKDRTIHNLLGRERMFLGRVDSNMLKSALAYTPQSTISSIVNQAVIGLHREVPQARLLLQEHDSLKFSVKRSAVDSFIPVVRRHMETTLTANYMEFIIPADFEVGPNFKSLQRYLTLEEEFYVKQHLAEGKTIPQIVAALGVNKDAVQAVQEGKTWR